jgi:hypothetical protein
MTAEKNDIHALVECYRSSIEAGLFDTKVECVISTLADLLEAETDRADAAERLYAAAVKNQVRAKIERDRWMARAEEYARLAGFGSPTPQEVTA